MLIMSPMAAVGTTFNVFSYEAVLELRIEPITSQRRLMDKAYTYIKSLNLSKNLLQSKNHTIDCDLITSKFTKIIGTII